MICPLSTKRVKPFRHDMVDDASEGLTSRDIRRGAKNQTKPNKIIKEGGEKFPD